MILRRRFLLAANDLRATRRSPLARVSTGVLMIATVLLLLVLLGTAVAAWVITRPQPPDQPLRVPSVSQARFS
jgi:cell division septal protein FtsQ